MTTPYLQFTGIDTSSNQQGTQGNTTFTQIDAALAGPLSISLTGQTSPLALTVNQALRCIAMTVTGTTSGAFTIQHPAYNHLFGFYNNNSSGQSVTVCCPGYTGVTIRPGTSAMLYCNGTDVQYFDPVKPFNIGVYVPQIPSPNAVVLAYIFADYVNFPAGLTGSQGSCLTTATATSAYSMYKNGTEVGTITWSASTAAPAFAMSTATSFVPGDILQITAPSSVDVTLLGIFVTLAGTRNNP